MHASLRLLLLEIAIVATPAARAEEFQTHFDRATLKMGKEACPRVRVTSPWYAGIRIGVSRYRVDGDTVIQFDGHTGNVVGKARATDGAKLRWLGAVQDVAFLSEQTSPVGFIGPFGRRPALPGPIVRRCDLKKLEWLPPLSVAPQPPPENTSVKAREAAALEAWEEFLAKHPNSNTEQVAGKPKRRAGISEVLADDRGTVILSYLDLPVNAVGNLSVLGFQVSLFAPGAEKPSWSHWIDIHESPQRNSPFSGSPSIAFHSDRPAVNRLIRTKTGIVVCLPVSQDLLGFTDAGEQEWRLPRIWEFERWNTGPSSGLWGIDRFGFEVEEDVRAGTPDGDDPKAAEEQRKAAQEEIDKMVREQRAVRAQRSDRFYKDYQAWIAAGPIVVRDPGSNVDERLFIATVRTRYPYNIVVVPECTIYAIEPDGGWIAGMTPIPRAVYSRPQMSIPRASVWACEEGSLARIGFDCSDDLRCPVEWFREYPGLVPWDDSDETGQGASTKISCVADETLFRTGFKCDREEVTKTLNFKINVVDLRTSLARDMTLTIPYDGRVPERESEMPDAPGCGQGFGGQSPDFAVAIEAIEFQDNTLRFSVRTGRVRTSLEFDIKKLLPKRDPD